MSGLELAGLFFTVYPLAIKFTQLATRAFSAYPDEEEHQDRLLALDVQRQAFIRWVKSRQFMSQRAFQYRLRKSEDQKAFMDQYILACQLILRILTVLGKIQVLLDKSQTPPEHTSNSSRKSSRAGGSRSTGQKDFTSALAMRHMSSLISTAVSVASTQSILQTKTDYAINHNTQPAIGLELAKYLEEAESQIPDISQNDQLIATLRSFGNIVQPSSSTIDVSKSRKIKDVFRDLVLNSPGKLELLIAKIKEWNEALDNLLKELVAQDICQPSDHSYRIPFDYPFAKNQSFIGRKDILESMELHFDAELSCKVVVLHGPGGYGKTQISLQYTHTFERHYTSMIWIDAASVSTIVTSAERFLTRLIVEHWPISLKIPMSSGKDYMEIARRLGIDVEYKDEVGFEKSKLLKRIAEDPVDILGYWLAKQDNNRWLVIADNFDNPEETGVILNSLIPNRDVGHIIVTTQAFKPQRLNLKGDVTYIKVGGFEEGKGETLTLLGKLSEIKVNELHEKNQEEYKAAKEITKELDHHPLYITVAGACITQSRPRSTVIDRGGGVENSTIFQNYYKTFNAFIRLNPHDQRRKESFVLECSYKRLSPSAQKLFGIFAQFSSTAGIPSTLFDRWLNKAELPESRVEPPDLFQTSNRILEFERLLSELCSFHLITTGSIGQRGYGTSPEAYHIHSEVQKWWRSYTKNQDERAGYTKQAYTIVSSSLTLDPQARTSTEWAYEKLILSHLEYMYEMEEATTTPRAGSAATNHTPFSGWDTEILYPFAQVFNHHSRYQPAEALYRKVLKKVAGIESSGDPISKKLMELPLPEVPKILDAIDSLGMTLMKLGNTKEAREWAQHAYNWTFTAQELAKPHLGIELESATLVPAALDSVAREPVALDPVALQRMTHLATCLEATGDPKGALSKLEELKKALQESEQSSMHEIRIVEIQKTMAEIHFNQGNSKESFAILDQIQRSWSSTDRGHPLILAVQQANARYKHNQGKYQEAADEYEELLAGTKRLLGSNHFFVLNTMMKCAYTYCNIASRRHKAQEYFETAQRGFITLFGDGCHPSLLQALRGLATIKKQQGDYKGALEQFERIMINSRARASDVEEEYDAMNSVAFCSFRLGRYDQALLYYRKAEEYYKFRYGEKHAYTMIVSYGVATVLEALGKYKEALQVYREVWEVEKNDDSQSYYSTLLTVARIARVLEKLGKYSESESQFTTSVNGLVEAHGETHPDTLSVRQDQAQLLVSQGNHEEALRILETVITELTKSNADDPNIYYAQFCKARIIGGKRKKYDMAIVLLDQSLASWTKSLDTDHPWTLEGKHWKARFLAKKKKYDDALTLLTEVCGKQEEKLGKDHPDTLHTWCVVADVKYRQGLYSEANMILEPAVRGLKDLFKEPEHCLVIWAMRTQEKINAKLEKKSKWFGFALPMNKKSTSTPAVNPSTPSQ